MNGKIVTFARLKKVVMYCCILLTTIAEADTLYVDISQTGPFDGLSWQTAFPDFQFALDVARASSGSVTQIWVAEGKYVPSLDIDLISNGRFNTFFVDYEIEIYGGFAGWESKLQQRDWLNNITILSGDFNGDDGVFNTSNNGENAYTVIHLAGLSSSSKLSGFYIERGNGDYAGTGLSFHNRGAGLVTDDNGMECTPTIEDCFFRYNVVTLLGGAVYNHGTNGNASPTFRRCIFKNNYADQFGGAMMNKGYNTNSASSPILENCLFYGNESFLGGGAIYYDGGSSGASVAKIFNCTFTSNIAGTHGGALRLNDDSGKDNCITNTILWDNDAGTDGNDIFWSSTVSLSLSYSIYSEGGLKGNSGIQLNNNSTNDPLIFSISESYRPDKNSPAINHGDPSTISKTLDLDGNTRTYGDTIDAGAYEFLQCPSNNNIYVDQNSYSLGTGIGWDSPHRDLSMALRQACDCDDIPNIYVAEGVYVPTRSQYGKPSTYNEFHIHQSLNMYGGFNSLGEYNPKAYETVLSGDRRRDDYVTLQGSYMNYSENTRLVKINSEISGEFEFKNLSFVSGGYFGFFSSSYSSEQNIELIQCDFFNNSNHGVVIQGGQEEFQILLSQCTFKNNERSGVYGQFHTISSVTDSINLVINESIFEKNRKSGVVLYYSEYYNTLKQEPKADIRSAGLNIPVGCSISNSLFISNESDYGAAINFATDDTNVRHHITNCTFYDNQANEEGGAVFNNLYAGSMQTSILNCILWENKAGTSINNITNAGSATSFIAYSLLDEDCSFIAGNSCGLGMLANQSPNFRNPDFGILSLMEPSPAINSGINFANMWAQDIIGAPRVQNNIDMGAYEHTGSCPDTIHLNGGSYPPFGILEGTWTASEQIIVSNKLISTDFNTSLNAPEVTVLPTTTKSANSIFEINQTGCKDCIDYSFGDNVQAQVDAGCSPIALYNAGVPLDSIYGIYYQGGIIFFLDTLDEYDFEGMICAPKDQSLQTWNCRQNPSSEIPIGTGESK